MIKPTKKQLQTTVNINYPGLGEVVFRPNVRAKYIRISLKPFRGILVSVPPDTSLEKAMAFVNEKTEWISKNLIRMKGLENKQIIFSTDTDFSTGSHKLKLIPWKTSDFRGQLSKNDLKIFYPQHIDLSSDNAQKIIRGFIIQTLRLEAKDELPKRTTRLAEQYGYTFRGVTVKNVSSRWGSCSGMNHINLNIHLMRLPENLRDYVILHELAHTIHKNHGPEFWKCLDKSTSGKAKQLAGAMKKYNIRF